MKTSKPSTSSADVVVSLGSEIRDALASVQPIVTESVAFVAQPKQFALDADKLSRDCRDKHLALYAARCDALTRLSAEVGKAGGGHPRARELVECANSVWLHELYFANCFKRESRLSIASIAYARFKRDWGDFAEWQRDVIARIEACSSGWVAVGWSDHLQRYVAATIAGDADGVPAGFVPVFVVDCWEHARSDFADDRRAYADAVLREVDWDVVCERVSRVEASR